MISDSVFNYLLYLFSTCVIIPATLDEIVVELFGALQITLSTETWSLSAEW